MEDRLQEMADKLTENIMSFVFGDRYDNADDITEDEELSKAWEYINEASFGMLWYAYDEGKDDAYGAMKD